jgi:hypothetical protein
MQDNEAQQLLLEILSQAEEGKFTEFHLITSWAEFKFYWRSSLSTRLIIRTLEKAANNLFKAYCKKVATGSADVSELLAYSELQEVIAFYTKDLVTIRRMLDEYDEYLGHGHFWYSFLGGERDI